jgi:hypothetical protein
MIYSKILSYFLYLDNYYSKELVCVFIMSGGENEEVYRW